MRRADETTSPGASDAAVVPAVMLAAIATAWALYAMWAHAILHWYADAWRANLVLLDIPWWRAPLIPDNSHRLVTSQLLWWVDVRLFGGDQRILRVVGIAWVVGTLLLLARTAARAADSSRWLRAQVFLVLVLGVTWLGNARMLGHPYEAVHVYLVILLITIAATVVAQSVVAPLTWRARSVLVGAGVLATFVFGSGGALLPAVALVLIIARARPADHAAVAGGLLIAAVLFVALPGAGPARGSLDLAPMVQADLVVRWITTPMLYLALPAIDPDVARLIPVAPVAALLVPLAEGSRHWLGDVWSDPAPQRVIGLLALAWLLWVSSRAWRGQRPSAVAEGPTGTQLAMFGLVFAWSAVGIGGLVAMARHEYFAELPRQVHASRYVPWSSLFWAGLAATTLAQYAERVARGRVALAVAAIACAVLASNIGGHALSAREAALAAAQSAAARAGVEPQVWGETDRNDYHAALPVARRYRVGPWAPTADAPD